MTLVVYSNAKHREDGINKFDVFGKSHYYTTPIVNTLDIRAGEPIVMVYTHKNGLKSVIFGRVTHVDSENEVMYFEEIKSRETKLSWSQILGDMNYRGHYKLLTDDELGDLFARISV